MASSLNTGASNTVALKVIKQSFFVQRIADDGTVNCIPAGTSLDSAYVNGKINETDPSKRWYPVGLYKNVTPTDQTLTTESFNDGSTAVTTKTPASFSGFLVDADTSQLDPINQLACNEMGVFEVDVCNRLIGYVDDGSGACSCDNIAAYDATEELCPIPVAKTYPQALYNSASDTTSAKINVVYEYDQIGRIGAWKYAEPDGVNLLSVKGLYDASISAAADSDTQVTATVVVRSSKFGSTSQVPLQGLLSTDFTLTDSAGSAIAISAATEGTPGVYTLTVATTTGETATLSAAKTGFCITPDSSVVFA